MHQHEVWLDGIHCNCRQSQTIAECELKQLHKLSNYLNQTYIYIGLLRAVCFFAVPNSFVGGAMTAVQD